MPLYNQTMSTNRNISDCSSLKCINCPDGFFLFVYGVMSSCVKDSTKTLCEILQKIPRGWWYNMLPEDDKDADSLLLALSLPKDKLVSTLRDTCI